MSFENKWKNYQRIVESTGKGHLAPNKFQQKMKARRRRNDVYTSPVGAKDSSKSKPWTGKVKKFGGSNTYFENINEADQEVLDSFSPQETLNPAAFEGDMMIPEIRERLLEIVADFIDGIEFKMDVEDIILTGSLANYNWSKYSDFDLHLLVDFTAIDGDKELVKRFFQDLKAVWNIRHNIFLKGYEVEIYVQDTNEVHVSTGVYSVQNDEWDVKPEREETARFPIDQPNIEKKADDIVFQIDRAENLLKDDKLTDALDAIDRLKQKVRNLRKTGLSKEDGVYSVENLAFKTLRRSGELERLSTLKNKAYDKHMSIKQ
jgi:predicted nucleotidyltransferase